MQAEGREVVAAKECFDSISSVKLIWTSLKLAYQEPLWKLLYASLEVSLEMKHRCHSLRGRLAVSGYLKDLVARMRWKMDGDGLRRLTPGKASFLGLSSVRMMADRIASHEKSP